jgi:3-oxoacyl-[acyl-carrier-protein] synthase-1
LKEVYIASDNIITSLGFSTEENASALKAGQTGIKMHSDDQLSPSAFWASRVDDRQLSQRFSVYDNPNDFTRFEQLVICSVMDALSGTSVSPTDGKTLFVLSTTKGNVDLLNRAAAARFNEQRIYLWNSASLFKGFFKLSNQPWVVSNACISGVIAIMAGVRAIRTGIFDHAIITGADLVTEFVLSGFNSFLSLCEGPCKPFDKERKGLSLGEGAGTIILTSDRNLAAGDVKIAAGPGYSTNDANHISGPSRTGEGLYLAIKRTLGMTESGWQKADGQRLNIDYISAHGTATPYNDEMEALALTRAGLQEVPVNSFKGYWGHTLGAAGIIESVAGVYSMRHDLLFDTKGFDTMGVSHPVSVIRETRKSRIHTFLKIASGFGGCNASQLFFK